MNNESTCKTLDCVPIAWDLAIGQRIAKVELAVSTIVDDDTTNCAGDFSKKEAIAGSSDATTAVAAIITQEDSLWRASNKVMETTG